VKLLQEDDFEVNKIKRAITIFYILLLRGTKT
jgi:hypothetical protein